MSAPKRQRQFVVCIRCGDYPVSLEERKIYEILPDPEAAKHQQIRVVDESGDSYLYPEGYFIVIDLPEATRRALVKAA